MAKRSARGKRAKRGAAEAVNADIDPATGQPRVDPTTGLPVSTASGGGNGSTRRNLSPEDAEVARRNLLPASQSSNSADKRSDEARLARSAQRFPGDPKDKAAAKRTASTSGEAESKGKKEPARAKSLDDVQGEQPKAAVFGQVDHAQANHTRAEHEHTVADNATRVEGPAPRRLSDAASEADVLEQIRLETKADNLYFLRRQERGSDAPREHVIASINARLLEVQGAPILPE